MKRLGCGPMVFVGIKGFEHHGFGVDLPIYLM